jgi:hypothetical protein
MFSLRESLWWELLDLRYLTGFDFAELKSRLRSLESPRPLVRTTHRNTGSVWKPQIQNMRADDQTRAHGCRKGFNGKGRQVDMAPQE